jgi:hypothetical protein
MEGAGLHGRRLRFTSRDEAFLVIAADAQRIVFAGRFEAALRRGTG